MAERENPLEIPVNYIKKFGSGVNKNLNLNSLLVTGQMTLFHQGVRMVEKLVP